ncbi:carboxymuconolactone decarboxylase family protein [Algicella marina]|uniref:carboxymuconolactone decarboxylase family protein n=1 Tax=Algicella marina TaxID=2683284 RepID=UPI0024E00450|nr:carboxymuconolactone decarboxylase family protein [Algicella marina]
MNITPPIEYEDATAEVRAIYDDIRATRGTDYINNVWKCFAHNPKLLRRTWESVKEVMGPGTLDPVVKEMIYLAVSISNNCGYCIASHSAGAQKAGMTDEMFGEVMDIVGMANENNKLVAGYRVPIDDVYLKVRGAD